MKLKPLNLKIDKEIQKISEYIVEIVSEAFPLMEEDKRELKEIVDTEVYDLIDKLKQRLKSACVFYLRYKDNPELLAKEYPEYKEKIEEFIFELEDAEDGFDILETKHKYNEWLFKLTFKLVFEESEK